MPVVIRYKVSGNQDLGGIKLNDAVNQLSLPGHKGPHTQAYHQWVYDRLNAAIQGLTDQEEIRAAFEEVLNAIAEELKNDPGLTNMK